MRSLEHALMESAMQKSVELLICATPWWSEWMVSWLGHGLDPFKETWRPGGLELVAGGARNLD